MDLLLVGCAIILLKTIKYTCTADIFKNSKMYALKIPYCAKLLKINSTFFERYSTIINYMYIKIFKEPIQIEQYKQIYAVIFFLEHYVYKNY